MSEQNGNQPPPTDRAKLIPGLLVAPTPMATLVDVLPASVMPDNQARILLRIEGPNGSFQFPMEVGHAKQLAEHLAQRVQEAGRGLVIPKPKIVPPIKPGP